MVNNQNMHPVYDLATVKAYVLRGDFELVNRRARDNYKSLSWSTCQLKALVKALNVRSHYRGSAFAQKTSIGEIDVDKYVIRFDEDELVEDRSPNGLEFFIKLAIQPEEPNVAIISFHLSGQP